MADKSLKRIERLFHAAIKLRGQERDEYLTRVCGSDNALRHNIESLIAASFRYKPPPINEPSEPVTFASEAIAVVDMVQATATSDRFGWYAVGRNLVRELRQMIATVGKDTGLSCIKSTGDGFLLTIRNGAAAELAAVEAVRMMLKLLERLAIRNEMLPEERHIDIRAAVHFGEVDVLEQDREGPNVSYTFRIEAVGRGNLPEALNPLTPSEFPLHNYVLCSERVNDILRKRNYPCDSTSCGLFKLRGFSGWSELFLIKTTNSNVVH